MKRWLLLLFLPPKLFPLYMGNRSALESVHDGFFFSAENGLAIKAGYQREEAFDRNMGAISKVSGRIDLFILYSGVQYFNATARFKQLPFSFLRTDRYFKTKNRRKFGRAVGTTFSTGNRFGVAVETRLSKMLVKCFHEVKGRFV